MKTRHFFGLAFAFCALFNAELGFAQAKVDRINVNGLILRTKQQEYADLVGSPYYFEDWAKGNVKFADNTFARNADLKYDGLEDVLVTKAPDGSENTFNDPITEFTLDVKGKMRLFRSGFTGGAMGSKKKTFYEVVYDGKTKILKRNNKIIIESKGYNTGVVTKKIEGEDAYYLVNPDQSLTVIKNNDKSILAAINKPELSSYLKEKKLNLKNDADIVAFMTYVDTL